MKVSESFVLQEFVCREIHTAFGNRSIWFIDQRIIDIAQYLRSWLAKPVTINNWHNGGNYNESGLRRFDTSTGGKFSLHKYGKAIDIKVKDMKPVEVYQSILQRKDVFMKMGLTAVEDTDFTPTWLHLDCRNNPGAKDIMIVKP